MKRKQYHPSVKLAVALKLEHEFLSADFIKSIAPSRTHGWKGFKNEHLVGHEFARTIDENLTDIQLITKAFSVGRITRHDPITDSGHGIGLYIGAAKARDMNANITIRQQNFSIELKWKDDHLVLNQSSEGLKSIPGPNICFDFSIE